MGTMKEAHVHSDTTVTIHDVPIPQITHPSQILIKVIVSGTNPKVRITGCCLLGNLTC